MTGHPGKQDTTALVEPARRRRLSPRQRDALQSLRRDRRVAFGLAWVVVATLLAVFAPVFATHEPEALDMTNRLTGFTAEHWLGTDHLGRDVYSRLLYGGRISLSAAVYAVAVAVAIGLPLGLLSGYLAGWWDFAISRVTDAVMSIPPLVLALAIVAALGPSVRNAMTALGLVYAPRVFRIARGATLSARERTFVTAAIGLGAPTARVVRRHVLPNVLSPVLVQVFLMLGFALLAEAGLSFLGLGAQPPDASWGVMMGHAFGDLHRAPLLIVYPGVAVAMSALAFNYIGDGLRDALSRDANRAGVSDG